MNLKKKVLNALGWSASAKFLGQIVTWAVTIYVIRLLEPEDYGLMAMAVLVSEFLGEVNSMGAAIIQNKKIDKKFTQTMFALILLVNYFFSICVYSVAPVVAWFFGEERLIDLIRVLSIYFLIFPFVQYPSSMLERDLNLKKTAIVYFIAQLSGSAITLLFAMNGFGVWSLIYGTLSIVIVRAIGLNLVTNYLCLPIIHKNYYKNALAFSGFVTIERIMRYIYSRSDSFIIGKLMGKELLGIYSVANHLAGLIMHKTGELIYVITLPAFSRIQSDVARVKEYMHTSSRIMSFIIFPLFFGLSSIATELVQVLLGDKWASAAIILTLLCLVMPLRMLNNLLVPVLQAVNKANVSAFNLFISALSMTVAFLLFSRWGLLGICIAWLGVYPIVFLVTSRRCLSCINGTLLEYLSVISKPLIFSTLMFGAVLIFKLVIANQWDIWIRLISSILIGIFVYVLLVVMFDRKTISDIVALRSSV